MEHGLGFPSILQTDSRISVHMRLRTLSLAILFAGLGLWTLFVQQENQRLTRRLSESRSRLDELQTVETENVQIKGLLARQQMSETEVDRLRQEARDVLRLRAEVTSLRNLRQENDKLTDTILQLSNQVQTAIQVA